MLPPKVTCSCKGYFFSNSNTDCKTVVRCLCVLGSGRALIYDDLYIELNDVKGRTFARQK